VSFGARSEVGRLRRVMVHRSALEPTRLTPSNAGELLFDDVLWVARAKADVERDVGLAWESADPTSMPSRQATIASARRVVLR
jgi:hypothetical protein